MTPKRSFSRLFLSLLWLLLALSGPGPAVALAAEAAVSGDPGWRPLLDRLAADGLDRTALTRLFAGNAVAYDPSIMARKVDAMVKKEFEPKPKPSPKTLAQSNYRHFLVPAVIDGAVAFIRANQAAFDRARREFGPPPELVAAFLVVETKLGSYLGDRDAVSVLASLARSSDIDAIAPSMKTLQGDPDRRAFAANAARDRAEWAYRELLALLRYATATGKAPRTIPGSIYGAIGICQFMPTNALTYGIDADGDGVVDLFAPCDAIVSVASYLRGHGYRPDMTEAETAKVVYAYNHSDLYVLGVMAVADRIKARLGGR
ncbi:Lytic transglycosylase catalytic [Solidesulfovibrio carbinoliphilus subsp. oakridgensis]|uniref:Lytic transglycosylase catalytic n=1 Tax=Solidesulfovibrio carbinoliphilus subsp. oakridgensis TaxID=694327 RepID=G7Q795_9BACT|nr:lytic murein transglycosylase [Solidesulfovibrio carbinoliphilus]EHJ49052.1 Lytic transglycosylase catalytic [Solidesulfovibrio carbinoliphilus subsp. oakridgensis]